MSENKDFKSEHYMPGGLDVSSMPGQSGWNEKEDYRPSMASALLLNDYGKTRNDMSYDAKAVVHGILTDRITDADLEKENDSTIRVLNAAMENYLVGGRNDFGNMLSQEIIKDVNPLTGESNTVRGRNDRASCLKNIGQLRQAFQIAAKGQEEMNKTLNENISKFSKGKEENFFDGDETLAGFMKRYYIATGNSSVLSRFTDIASRTFGEGVRLLTNRVADLLLPSNGGRFDAIDSGNSDTDRYTYSDKDAYTIARAYNWRELDIKNSQTDRIIMKGVWDLVGRDDTAIVGNDEQSIAKWVYEHGANAVAFTYGKANVGVTDDLNNEIGATVQSRLGKDGKYHLMVNTNTSFFDMAQKKVNDFVDKYGDPEGVVRMSKVMSILHCDQVASDIVFDCVKTRRDNLAGNLDKALDWRYIEDKCMALVDAAKTPDERREAEMHVQNAVCALKMMKQDEGWIVGKSSPLIKQAAATAFNRAYDFGLGFTSGAMDFWDLASEKATSLTASEKTPEEKRSEQYRQMTHYQIRSLAERSIYHDGSALDDVLGFTEEAADVVLTCMMMGAGCASNIAKLGGMVTKSKKLLKAGGAIKQASAASFWKARDAAAIMKEMASVDKAFVKAEKRLAGFGKANLPNNYAARKEFARLGKRYEDALANVWKRNAKIEEALGKNRWAELRAGAVNIADHMPAYIAYCMANETKNLEAGANKLLDMGGEFDADKWEAVKWSARGKSALNTAFMSTLGHTLKGTVFGKQDATFASNVMKMGEDIAEKVASGAAIPKAYQWALAFEQTMLEKAVHGMRIGALMGASNQFAENVENVSLGLERNLFAGVPNAAVDEAAKMGIMMGVLGIKDYSKVTGAYNVYRKQGMAERGFHDAITAAHNNATELPEKISIAANPSGQKKYDELTPEERSAAMMKIAVDIGDWIGIKGSGDTEAWNKLHERLVKEYGGEGQARLIERFIENINALPLGRRDAVIGNIVESFDRRRITNTPESIAFLAKVGGYKNVKAERTKDGKYIHLSYDASVKDHKGAETTVHRNILIAEGEIRVKDSDGKFQQNFTKQVIEAVENANPDQLNALMAAHGMKGVDLRAMLEGIKADAKLLAQLKSGKDVLGFLEKASRIFFSQGQTWDRSQMSSEEARSISKEIRKAFFDKVNGDNIYDSLILLSDGSNGHAADVSTLRHELFHTTIDALRTTKGKDGQFLLTKEDIDGLTLNFDKGAGWEEGFVEAWENELKAKDANLVSQLTPQQRTLMQKVFDAAKRFLRWTKDIQKDGVAPTGDIDKFVTIAREAAKSARDKHEKLRKEQEEYDKALEDAEKLSEATVETEVKAEEPKGDGEKQGEASRPDDAVAEFKRAIGNDGAIDADLTGDKNVIDFVKRVRPDGDVEGFLKALHYVKDTENGKWILEKNDKVRYHENAKKSAMEKIAAGKANELSAVEREHVAIVTDARGVPVAIAMREDGKITDEDAVIADPEQALHVKSIGGMFVKMPESPNAELSEQLQELSSGRNRLWREAWNNIAREVVDAKRRGYKFSPETERVLSLVKAGGTAELYINGFVPKNIIFTSPFGIGDYATTKNIDHAFVNHNQETLTDSGETTSYSGRWNVIEFDKALRTLIDNKPYGKDHSAIVTSPDYGHGPNLEKIEFDQTYFSADRDEHGKRKAYTLHWTFVRQKDNGKIVNAFTGRNENEYPDKEKLLAAKGISVAGNGEVLNRADTPFTNTDPLKRQGTVSSISNPFSDINAGRNQISSEMANRINEEAKKIGAVTRVEDAETGKPAILLGYHGTRRGGFTKFDPSKSDDGISLFMAGTKNTSQSYVGTLPTKKPFDLSRYSKEHAKKAYEEMELISGIADQFDKIIRGEEIDITDVSNGNVLVKYNDLKSHIPEMKSSLKYWESLGNYTPDMITKIELLENVLEQYDTSVWNNPSPGVRGNEKGIYNLAMRFKNPLVIDANNSTWNHIKYKEATEVPLTKKEIDDMWHSEKERFRINIKDTADDLVYYLQEAGHDLDSSTIKSKDLDNNNFEKLDKFISDCKKASGVTDDTDLLDILLDPTKDLVGKAALKIERIEFFKKRLVTANDYNKWMKDFYGTKKPKRLDPEKYGATREIAEKALAKGYDGVIIKNCIDDGGRGNLEVGPDTIFINFDGKNVKMVDDLTYDDAGNIIPAGQRLDFSNPDARYNVTGMKGLERIVGPKEYKKLEKEIQKIFDTTYAHIAKSHKGTHDKQGGVPSPRMWEVEKKMQDGSVKLSLKVGGKTMHVHFTGAATDNKARLEYAGNATNIDKNGIALLKNGKANVHVSDIINDDVLKKAYPEIWNAPIVIAEKGDYSGAGAKTTVKITGDVGTKEGERTMKILDLPVRQEVVTDRGASRNLMCAAMPARFSKRGNKKTDDMIVVYTDSLDAKNLKQINKDMGQAIVDLIAAKEGWRNASQFSLKDWQKTGMSTRNTVGSDKENQNATNERNKTGMYDGLPYKVFALFGDPKLSLANPDSLLNKVIAKYVDQYKGKKNAEVDEVTATKVRDIIIETLATAYQQFAGIKESKAWSSRMGMDWREIGKADERLLDIDKEGLVEAGQGLQGTRASENVVKFYDEKVAENVDKALKKFFKTHDKTFRQMFDEERKEFLIQREAQAAARSFNPTKVRSEAAYQAYLAYCNANGIKPRPEEDVKAWLSYKQQTGEEGQVVGRKKVKDKVKSNRSVSLSKGNGEGDHEIMDARSADRTTGMYNDLDAAADAMEAKAQEKMAAEHGEKWDTERDIAVKEIVDMIKSGKVAPNRMQKEMYKIVRKHSTVKKTVKTHEENGETVESVDSSIINMRVAEITADVAKALNVTKYAVSGGGNRNTKSVEDYLTEATAAKMVRGRIYGQKKRNEESIDKWIRKEAKRVGVNEADVEAYATKIKDAADKMAVKCMDQVRANATADEIKRIIGKMGHVNGMSRDLANAFAHGSDSGVAGQYATHRAETLADQLIRRQERNARGIGLNDLNAKIGFDVVKEIEKVGVAGSPYANGDDFATTFVKNFSDIMRRRKAEYSTMNDNEFAKDSRARQDLAMTVKSWMREMAKRLTYGDTRRDLEVEAARIASDSDAAPTFDLLQKTVQNCADRISDYIRRNGSNESNELMKSIIKFIDKNTGAANEVKQGEITDRRKHDPNQQGYWHLAKKAMKMSSTDAADRIAELQNELALSFADVAKVASKKSEQINADEIIQQRHDKMLELHTLLKYGGMKEKSYGEIRDIFDNEIANDISGAADAFSQKLEAQAVEYKRVINAFTSELGAFRDRKGRKFNEIKKNDVGSSFLIGSIADLFKRMEAHLHEGSEAYEEIEKFRRAMSLAHLKQGNFNMAWEKELRMAVKSIYGEDFEKVVERLSLKDEKYDEFSRTAWEIDEATGLAKKTGAGSAYMPTRLSKGNLIYIYLARRQGDMQENNRIYGCDDVYMDKLLNCLDAKDIQLAEWLTAAYGRMREQINPVSESVTGLKVLSPDELYCPLDFLQKHVSGDSRKYSSNPFPTFLTRRVGHDKSRLDEAQDPIRIFENHIQDSGHYIGFGEIMQKVSMTFKDASVQDAYAQLIGSKAKNDMYSQLAESLNGERSDASFGLTGVRNFITASSLFYNVGSAMKQLEGVGGWAIEMGVMPWLKSLVVNSVTSSEVRQGMRELEASGIFRVRGEEGISEAMVALANSADGVKHGVVSKSYNWYKRHGMDVTKMVDRLASQSMAAQYYTMRKKFYMNASGGGCDEATARERAIADTDYAIQVTQQSGRPEFLHYAQRGSTAGKLITQFSGPAFVRWGVEIEALHRAFVMGDKGAKRRLASKMIAMHLICAPILAMASGLATMILGDDKQKKDLWEKTRRDCAIGMVNGPMTGWFIYGQILNAGTYKLYDAMSKKRAGQRKHFEAPILSKLGSLQEKSVKAFTDVMKCINWGSIDKSMIDDVQKDADDLLKLLLPVYRVKNTVEGVVK